MGNEQSTLSTGDGALVSEAVRRSNIDKDKEAKARKHARQLEQRRLANIAKKRADREAGDKETDLKSGENAQRDREEEAALKPPSDSANQEATNGDRSSRRSSGDSAIALPQSSKPQPGSDNARPIKVPTGPSRRSHSDYSRGMALPLPSIHGVKRLAAPQSEDTPSNGSDLDERIERQPPDWYIALSIERKRGKDEVAAAIEPMLGMLKTKIRQCKEGTQSAEAQQSTYNEIRRRLHELPFQSVNEKLLRRNSMLSNEIGLPQLFDDRYSGGVAWPFDIKADAKELYNKWYNRIFETDLLRGIIPGKGKSGSSDRSSDKLDRNWSHGNPQYHGNGDLVNGQWWPTQLAALRDGAHGSAQAGIHGKPGEGAFSCIMAGNHDYMYADKDDGDKDEGEVVYYCGTDSTDGNITTGTKLMIESCADGRPVRLLRSHKVQSRYAPKMGLRYDGLYDVVDYERLDAIMSVRQRYRFKLVRQPRQDPIRGGHGPEARPTQQEMEAHQKDKRLRGIGGGGAVKGKKGTVFPTWG